MKSVIFPGLIACLVLSACSSHPTNVDNNDAMIEQLSASQRRQIDTARADLNHRSDELAAARQDIVRAKAEWTVAKAELDVAQARVDKVQAEVKVAETGTTDELDKARAALREAEADIAPKRGLIHWRDAEISRCRKAETVAECRHELAECRVELEKARAFVKTDQAASRHVDVPEHEAHVRDAEKKEALAVVELEAAQRECEVAERAYKDAKSDAKK